MLSLTSYIFLFGFPIATSVAFKVSVPSSLVTAGQNGTVTWTRGLFDPLTFTLTLHDVIRNTDGQATTVNSGGNFSGPATFNFLDAGTFQIILFAKTVFQIPVSLTSGNFSVNTAPQSASSQASSTSTSALASNALTTIPSQSTTSTSSSSDGTLASSSQSFTTAAQSSTAVSGHDMNTSATDTGSTSNPTASVSTTLAKSPVNTGAIIGGVLGALAFIFLVLLAFWVCRRRRKQKTGFFRDMMVRRRSPALLFSQATVPSMRSSERPVADVADVEDPEKAGGYEQLLRSAFMTGHHYARYAESFASNDAGPISSNTSLRTSMSPLIFSPIAPLVNSSSSRSLDIQHATWTHRQVMIHDKVIDLQAKLIAKQSWSLTDTMDDYDVNDLKNRIARLEQLMLSAWALGFTDETPEGLD